MSCTRHLRAAVGTVVSAFCLAGGSTLLAEADVRVASGLRVEVVATGIARPVQLALDVAGSLVVLSHGRGEAAAELYRLDLTAPLPVDVSRAPRVMVPFSEGPRKTAFGSLAFDPRSGDLFLGEENGNRIYRLTGKAKLTLFAVGLQHLVGGGSLAFDEQGRLVVLDFASPQGHMRSETPLPPALDWLAGEAYRGPLVFRIDPHADIPLPRRLDLVAPLFPKGSARGAAEPMLPRFISVATAGQELRLLGSLGEVFRLSAEGDLQLMARLPAGHYHRTNMAMGPDGGVFVSSGFHLRQVFRISPAGIVMNIAQQLGDPGGIVIDRAGSIYIAETALHRIIRISPSSP